jgi:hypothetical protein
MPFMRRAFLGDVSAAGVDVAKLRQDPDAVAVLFTLQAASSNRVSGLRSLRRETRHLLQTLEHESSLRPR